MLINEGNDNFDFDYNKKSKYTTSNSPERSEESNNQPYRLSSKYLCNNDSHLFDILQISYTDILREVITAFRKLTRENHSDK